MFSKSEAARAMREEGVVKEFEQRERIVEELRRVRPETVREFLGYISGSWLENDLGKHAVEKLKEAGRRGIPQTLSVEGFVSMEDGHIELLLPVSYARKDRGLGGDLIEHAKGCLEDAGTVKIGEYRGLVNLTVKIKNPGRLHRVVDALETPPESFPDAGIEYSLHVHHSARLPKAGRKRAHERGKMLYNYLESHGTINSEELSAIAGIPKNNANAFLVYETDNGNLKRVSKGVYSLRDESTKRTVARTGMPHRDSAKLGRGELKERMISYMMNHDAITVSDLVGLGAKNNKSAAQCLRAYGKEGILNHKSEGVYVKGSSFPEAAPPPCNSSAGCPTAPGLPLVAPIVKMNMPKEPKSYRPDMNDPVDRTYVVLKWFATRGGVHGYNATFDEMDELGVDRKRVDELVKTGYLEYAERNRRITLAPEGLTWLSQYRPGARD